MGKKLVLSTLKKFLLCSWKKKSIILKQCFSEQLKWGRSRIFSLAQCVLICFLKLTVDAICCTLFFFLRVLQKCCYEPEGRIIISGIIKQYLGKY